MSYLHAEHLSKKYDGHLAVDDVGLDIDAGEVFGLLGPNGAGKSTTMLLLAGLLKPDSGRLFLAGRAVDVHDRVMRKSLGLVPQDLAIYPELTARENLWFFGSLYGPSRATLRRRIDEVLEIIGLQDRADDLVQTFSGGMKRRLNFGVSLLHEPQLLILDEPTVGVDPQSRNHLINCVTQLASRGMAVIYASHLMEEVQTICHRVAIMDHGKILVCDRIDNLLRTVSSGTEIVVTGWHDDIAARIDGLEKVVPEDAGTTRLVLNLPAAEGTSDISGAALRILTELHNAQVAVESISTEDSDLDQLFLKLTGRQLRD